MQPILVMVTASIVEIFRKSPDPVRLLMSGSHVVPNYSYVDFGQIVFLCNQN